ncbi:hypothetical protein R5H30_09315 [Sulfitobacter sp. D35]|uniref:hypothetical protein n=1 Tax=Sulfitobacter sp. D35 TaxID=3083252 RepID=UPI00296FF826|nr:hypothetical protein [Sulfitobacter sp. D35]MDW4498177.1 hypothetical protein [Sulfitobacter sp. D35]
MATDADLMATLHPAAPHHLPSFITMPGSGDWLLTSMGVFLVIIVVGIGVIYLKLHALPEHMAHRGQKVQYEIVAVLALLALFTHNHAFWIVGLLLALVPIPDFSTPINLMAASLGRMSGLTPQDAPPTDEADRSGPQER